MENPSRMHRNMNTAAKVMIDAAIAAGLPRGMARHIANNFACALEDEESPTGVSLRHVSAEELREAFRYARRHWPDEMGGVSSDTDLHRIADTTWSALVAHLAS